MPRTGLLLRPADLVRLGLGAHAMHLVAVLTLAAAVAGGCATKRTSDKNLSFVDPAEATELAAGRGRLIPIGERKQGVFVDVRMDYQYRTEHIPGAMHLDLADLEGAKPLLAPFDPIIIYGEGYDGTVANATSKALIEQGMKNVYTLRGGLRAWKAAGNATEP